MKTIIENNTLYIFLEDKIHSNNVDQIETEMLEAINAYGGNDITLDAKNLEYISSAGLRLFLKVQINNSKPIKIIHMSDSVYEIFELTGFREIFDLNKE